MKPALIQELVSARKQAVYFSFLLTSCMIKTDSFIDKGVVEMTKKGYIQMQDGKKIEI